MTELLNKEIRGVTGKLIWGFVAGYTSILLSIAAIYFSTVNNFKDLQQQLKMTAENQGQKTEWIHKEMQQLEIRHNSLRNQVNLQQIEIERIKTKLNLN